MWLYDGVEIDDKFYNLLVSEGVIGFVYCIQDLSNGKKYIGKKLWVTKRKLPPLKGKVNKRHKIVETDWKTYYGSSDEVKMLVEQHGESNFRREILHFCYNKSELSYLELVEQVHREVLLDDEYYNAFIGVKINSRGLERLKK